MEPKKTYSIKTLGCKVNQCESDAICRSLDRKGMALVKNDKSPDICIVNTCTVTQKAAMQSRQAIRKAIKTFPNARIMVTGCYAQTDPRELAQIKGVTAIIGNTDKLNLTEHLPLVPTDSDVPPAIVHHQISEQKTFARSKDSAHGSRTRPFLKIQDGCNAFCTYCIVPYARGRSRSMPLHHVLEELKNLNQTGFLEVVLTGIHLGCYGQDLDPPVDLLHLLKIIDRHHPVKRVRLSSIEPMELTRGIIELVKGSGNVCAHFHIPLQSGDNSILSQMRRPYRREDFQRKVVQIHQQLPDAAIGVDVLVGFPGESDAAFENTRALIKSLPISYLHVFPFSPRKNTPAESFCNKVPDQVIKQRCKVLRDLGQIKKKHFYRGQIGKTVTVLVEGTRDQATGRVKGVSDNYLPVWFEAENRLKNRLVQTLITQVTPDLKVLGKIQACV